LPVRCVVEMNRGGCKAPIFESCRMACTAKCDSCKSNCVRPAASLPSARRRSTSLKLSENSRSVVVTPACSVAKPHRAYNPIVAGLCWQLRSSEPQKTRQCTVTALHHKKLPTITGRLPTESNHRSQSQLLKNKSRSIVGEEPPAGRVMASSTSARLHTTKRDWQRTVGARWWCVSRAVTVALRSTTVFTLGRDPRTVARRTSSVTISIGSISGLGNTDI
jgi:hypothetical protein